MRSEFRHGRRVEPQAPALAPAHPIIDLLQVAVWMAGGAFAIYLGLCAADAQYAVIDQVNQENVHAH